MEGVEPKMPGAPSGIQIMTPQQFVASAGDMPGDEEDVTEGSPRVDSIVTDALKIMRGSELSDAVQALKTVLGDREYNSRRGFYNFYIKQLVDMYSQQGVAEGSDDKEPFDYEKWKASTVKPRKPRGYKDAEALGKAIDSEQSELRKRKEQGVAEAIPDVDHMPGPTIKRTQTGCKRCHGKGYVYKTPDGEVHPMNRPDAKKYKCGKCDGIGFVKVAEQGVAEVSDATLTSYLTKLDKDNLKHRMDPTKRSDTKRMKSGPNFVKAFTKLDNRKQGVAESEEHLARIRKLSGLAEATTLPASSRDLKGQEFQDYMNRIKGTDDIDKKTGQVKLDKKGNEKYVSGKTKSDKYKMPYIHRSSIIEYLGPDGKTYDEDKIKQALSQRPKALLKQNEKMKHSNGEFEQFFNVGFAALTGIAVDEQTNNLIIVNTCPGAGSCKVDCFAMKGGKVQFKAAWQSDGRILTYLLNDPDGFFNQLSAEISKEEQLGQKGDKKFPNGWKTTIRWHDAGDFFSPEYLDMALKMAAKHPDTKFYAYTKMAGAALAQKPPNFIINWSEGANTSQEKQVKAKDANLDTTKNSRIVPDDLFQDLLVKDEKKNLVKGSSGQWQVQPDKLPELKQRLASEYGLSANSILSYDEYMAKRKSIPAGMKYNVIVAPGEGDISANDQNIISTLLLRH